MRSDELVVAELRREGRSDDVVEWIDRLHLVWNRSLWLAWVVERPTEQGSSWGE